MVNNWAGVCVDALLPSHCVLCDCATPGRSPLCGTCQELLIPNRRPCLRCALPLALHERTCASCQRRPPPWDAVIAPWQYDSAFAWLITQWKYHNRPWLTDFLAQLWWRGQAIPPKTVTLLPVPMHWTRRWHRGYNQAELLARALQRARSDAPLMVNTRVLRRRQRTAQQAGLSAPERIANLRSAFTLKGSLPGEHVVLVDDVMTTGATARSLATLLREAGAARVDLWCLARTPDSQVCAPS